VLWKRCIVTLLHCEAYCAAGTVKKVAPRPSSGYPVVFFCHAGFSWLGVWVQDGVLVRVRDAGGWFI